MQANLNYKFKLCDDGLKKTKTCICMKSLYLTNYFVNKLTNHFPTNIIKKQTFGCVVWDFCPCISLNFSLQNK